MKFFSIDIKSNLKIHSAGLTLIELLIAVAIACILTSIAVPSYVKYKEKARIVVAISDMKFLEKEILNFGAKNYDLPENLSVIGRDSFLDPWGRPYQYLKIQGVYDGKGKDGKDDKDDKDKPRKDHFLKPINSDFDLYSVGKDGESSTGLSSSKSRDDIVRANNGGFIGLASNY